MHFLFFFPCPPNLILSFDLIFFLLCFPIQRASSGENITSSHKLCPSLKNKQKIIKQWVKIDEDFEKLYIFARDSSWSLARVGEIFSVCNYFHIRAWLKWSFVFMIDLHSFFFLHYFLSFFTVFIVFDLFILFFIRQ